MGFSEIYPKTIQAQKLKAFRPRPFHLHPHQGKLTQLVNQVLQSKGCLKCEGSKLISPKSTLDKSRTKTQGISSETFPFAPAPGQTYPGSQSVFATSKSLKCERSKLISPKFNQNKSSTKTKAFQPRAFHLHPH